ncbi:latrotoxin-related protein [Wolbachia endosymbiont of Frankliniella intonsa]|uniref:latrotoxin-related protein n=1 Tax=Wolbachia endosymbiont of Frankliniella intonsa TaxID=2902422 RepID=UPI00244ECB92|nr:latrotoxin-related protein [Wolbachia endosymbiont of Frankliniella intonsa]WGJ61794.1 latrotoxin-related protein [Wolbachia endosymbiont of Frankliniella intonsa]
MLSLEYLKEKKKGNNLLVGELLGQEWVAYQQLQERKTILKRPKRDSEDFMKKCKEASESENLQASDLCQFLRKNPPSLSVSLHVGHTDRVVYKIVKVILRDQSYILNYNDARNVLVLLFSRIKSAAFYGKKMSDDENKEIKGLLHELVKKDLRGNLNYADAARILSSIADLGLNFFQNQESIRQFIVNLTAAKSYGELIPQDAYDILFAIGRISLKSFVDDNLRSIESFTLKIEQTLSLRGVNLPQLARQRRSPEEDLYQAKEKFITSLMGRVKHDTSFREFLNTSEGTNMFNVIYREKVNTKITSILGGIHSGSVKSLKDLYNLWFDGNGRKGYRLKTLEERGVNLTRMSSILTRSGAKGPDAFKQLYDLWFDEDRQKGYRLRTLEQHGVDLVRMSSILNGSGAKGPDAFKQLYDLWFDGDRQKGYRLRTLEQHGVDLVRMSSILAGSGANAANAFKQLYDLWFDGNGRKGYPLETLEEHGVDLVRMSSILAGSGAKGPDAFKELYKLWFDGNGERGYRLSTLEQHGVDLVRMSSILNGSGAKAADAFKQLYQSWFDENRQKGYRLRTLEQHGVGLASISSILNGSGAKAADAFKELYKLWFDGSGERGYRLKALEQHGVGLASISSILHGSGAKAADAFKELYKLWFDGSGERGYRLSTLEQHGVDLATMSSILNGSGAKAANAFKELYDLWFDGDRQKGYRLRTLEQHGVDLATMSSILNGSGAKAANAFKELYDLWFDGDRQKGYRLRTLEQHGVDLVRMSSILNGSGAKGPDAFKQLYDLWFDGDRQKGYRLKDLEEHGVDLVRMSSILNGSGAKGPDAFKELYDLWFDGDRQKGYRLRTLEQHGVDLATMSSILNGSGAKAANAFKELYDLWFDGDRQKGYRLKTLEKHGVDLATMSSILHGSGAKAANAFKELYDLWFHRNGEKRDRLRTLEKHSVDLATMSSILNGSGAKAANAFKELYDLWFHRNGEKRDRLRTLEKHGVDLATMSSILHGSGAKGPYAFKQLYKLLFDVTGRKGYRLKTLEEHGVDLATMSSILAASGSKGPYAFKQLYDLWFDGNGRKTQYYGNKLKENRNDDVSLVEESEIDDGVEPIEQEAELESPNVEMTTKKKKRPSSLEQQQAKKAKQGSSSGQEAELESPNVEMTTKKKKRPSSLEQQQAKKAKQGSSSGQEAELESPNVEMTTKKKKRPSSLEQQQAKKAKQGSSSGKECLAVLRHKREVESRCLFTWEDVDAFNEEKDERRDFSKIKIDSEKFINYVKDFPQKKVNQLIQLADEVKVTGNARDLVNRIIRDQKVMSHLERAGEISEMTMRGMMAKNVLADFLNGNYQGVAVNVGFMAGGQGFAKVAESVSLKGLKLAEEGRLLVGGALKAASPFLARGTSAFVIYDLVNQIKAFKNGTEEALVGIVGDGIYLGVEAAEIGVKVAEGFGILEGVSSVTGPIGAAIGAVVFVGTDIYMAVKRVDKIDQIVHLTGNEKFVEGLRAFIGMKPEKYIEELIEKKQLYNQLVKQGLEYLKQHSDIQRYVSPTVKLVDVCSEVPTSFMCNIPPTWELDNIPEPLRAVCSTYIGYVKKCVKKFEVDLDNVVLLDRKVENVTWGSREISEDLNDGKLFCFTKGDGEPAPSYGSYLCEEAIGVADLSPNKTGNGTLIALGKGDDIARGFKDSPSVFLVEDGDKKFTGGDKDDLFILMDNNITGMLKGGGGIDTLDLTRFAGDVTKVEVDLLNTGYVMYGLNCLWMEDVESVLGRKGSSESIFSACDTKFLDGQGSYGNTPDTILIRSQVSGNTCSYKIKIVVRPNTNINNQASTGEFNYIVLPERGKAVVNISSLLSGEASDRHNFFFNSSVSQLMGIYIQNVTQVYNHIVKSATFSFAPSGFDSRSYNISDLLNLPVNLEFLFNLFARGKSNLTKVPNSTIRIDDICNFTVADKDRLMSEFNSAFYNEMFNITISDIPVNASYRFGNQAEIKIGKKGKAYFLERTNKSSEEVIREYLPIAKRIGGMSFFVQSLLSNETVVIGSGDHEVIHSNPPYRSHLVGNGGENVYVIDSGTKEVVIHDVDEENSIDAIDLSNVAKEVQIIRSGNDLLLKATVKEQGSSCTVSLKDGVERYNKIHVIVTNVPMTISIHNNQWSLKPQPLVFEKDKEIIIVNDQDVEKDSKIITPRKGGKYKFVRSNNNDLMITNVFDASITEDDFCTITLKKFYIKDKMRKLYIQFADQEIVLRDHEKEISEARDVSIVKREYREENTKQRRRRRDTGGYHVHSSRKSLVADLNNQTEIAASSGTRPSSWINDLFGWIRSSVSGLLSSEPALPRKTSITPTPISQVDAPVDVNGTIMLLDVLVRKFTGKKYISEVDQSIPLLEARGYALNITKGFEKVVERAGLKSGVSMHRLNIDFVEIYKEVTGKIMSGKFDEISGVLSSYLEKACPSREAGCPGKLSSKKFDKFMVEFNSRINVVLNRSIQRILHNVDGRLEVDGAKQMNLEPQSYLSNASVQGHSKVSTCLSDIGVTKLVNNLSR